MTGGTLYHLATSAWVTVLPIEKLSMMVMRLGLVRVVMAKVSLFRELVYLFYIFVDVFCCVKGKHEMCAAAFI